MESTSLDVEFVLFSSVLPMPQFVSSFSNHWLWDKEMSFSVSLCIQQELNFAASTSFLMKKFTVTQGRS